MKPCSFENLEPLEPSGFELQDASTIFAPLEPPDYLVAGLLRRGSLCLIGGYGSSWKTWLALALLLAVASGRPWLGRFATKAGRATFLDWESGSYEMRRRIQALAAGMGIEPVGNIDFATMPDIYMGTPNFEAAVRRLARLRALIIIDSLRAASPGAEENDSSMRAGLDQLRRIGEETGCCFVVLVHGKKSGGSSAGDAREALRGSSAIFDAADSVLVASRSEDGPVKVQATKNRHGALVPPFEVHLEDMPDGGVRLTAEAAEPADKNSERLEAAAAKVIESIRKKPGCSKNHIRQDCKGGRNQVTDAALARLCREGKVVNHGTKSRPAYHPAPEVPQ